MTVKDQINIRLSDDDKARLKALQNRYGISQAAVITMLLRDKVIELKEKEGFDWPKEARKLGGR